MRNQILYERRYRKKMKPILVEQEKEALYNLEAHASALKDLTSTIFDKNAYDNLITDQMTPVLVSMSEQQGGLALVFAGDEEHTFTMTADFLKYLRNSTRRMASNLNSETLDKLNRTLSEGIREGEGLASLKNRVHQVYDKLDGYRALRVARTETLKASNTATNVAYKQTGYVKAKEWYVNPGACPICEEFSGKTVGLDDNYAELGENIDYTDGDGNEQSYAVSYDTIENPPLHPNCRCTIVPVR